MTWSSALLVLSSTLSSKFTLAQLSASDVLFEPNIEQVVLGLDVYSTSNRGYSFPDCDSEPLRDNLVCNSTTGAVDRAKALISLFTVEELIANTINTSPGVPRLGLPPYEWWSEALHGVASSPGVSFARSGNFSHATSFPQPITIGAAFDDDLVEAIATITSTEARAFNNVGRAGLDYWTPNINPFKDPRWGRGQETPGEDPLHLARYVFRLVSGLQGGINPQPYLKVAANCKHYAAYDLESWQGTTRFDFDAVVSPQDLVEYYLLPFQSCVRDAKAASVMCSYNSVNGVPSCANEYLLQKVLRGLWDFSAERWVVGDCDAIAHIWLNHHYVKTGHEAVAAALKAGTDLDCGGMNSKYLGTALKQSLVTREDLTKALVRQYASLIRLGYFDSADAQPHRHLDWSDVNTPEAQKLAYRAALEGVVLLKNDGILPLNPSITKVAFVGPWANATRRMQGNYEGVAPFLTSPYEAGKAAGLQVTFSPGTGINSQDRSGFSAAIEAARDAEVIIYAGGIDNSIELETRDRDDITWPGNQLELIFTLSRLSKPIVILQMGGGQVDSSSLKKSEAISALLWAGYPGQSGGSAIIDILLGKQAPAGRLPVTQYPANYVNQVPMTDMSLRASANNPGRTYQWYTGVPVFEYGYGIHYTQFKFAWLGGQDRSYNIQDLISVTRASAVQYPDTATFTSFDVDVQNIGKVRSDYVALLFISGNAGPHPAPQKRLIGYTRARNIEAGQTVVTKLPVTLGAIARVDMVGNRVLFPGRYTVTLDIANGISQGFELTGDQATLTQWV